MLQLIADPNVWASLLTLTVMEIVLGIDNLVFISVLTGRLPPALSRRARAIGLSLALLFRIALLATLSCCVDSVDPSSASSAPDWSGRELLYPPLFEYVSIPLTSFGTVSVVVPSSLMQNEPPMPLG